jgi:hypothetical protein
MIPKSTEISRICGVTRRTAQNWLSGARAPQPKYRKVIKQHFPDWKLAVVLTTRDELLSTASTLARRVLHLEEKLRESK